MKRRLFLATLPAAVLAGCGFELRRLEGIPFATLYLEAPPGSVVGHLRNALKSNKTTRLVATAGEAEAVLQVSQEERSKTILSLSGAGRVTEYRLGLKLTYSVKGQDGRTLAAAETLELARDITYDDAQLLAKGAEEQLLYRDMEESAARRILRRLQAIAPGAVR
jgi:LPS-assembly lipoprotein